MVVSDLLVEGFAELMEMGYTRHLEEDLDLMNSLLSRMVSRLVCKEKWVAPYKQLVPPS